MIRLATPDDILTLKERVGRIITHVIQAVLPRHQINLCRRAWRWAHRRWCVRAIGRFLRRQCCGRWWWRGEQPVLPRHRDWSRKCHDWSGKRHDWSRKFGFRSLLSRSSLGALGGVATISIGSIGGRLLLAGHGRGLSLV